MKTIKDIRAQFVEKLNNEDFVIDKSGVKVIEIVGESYIADEEVIFGNLSLDYAKREVEWYDSMSRNVYDLPKTPQIWKEVCDRHGFVNSNYGWVVYSEENGEQYKHCLRTLRKDKDSRRAMMIYTRPEMQWEYNENGRSDFMCTNTVQVLIRDNKLHYILNQRSCDSVFGAKNDLYWARVIQERLFKDLLLDYPELMLGDVIHQVGSLHVYERHFGLVE